MDGSGPSHDPGYTYIYLSLYLYIIYLKRERGRERDIEREKREREEREREREREREQLVTCTLGLLARIQSINLLYAALNLFRCWRVSELSDSSSSFPF